jgi:NAD(P)-dependent dehydrogenase (short-subunit alcohol dehydrogenase family)
VLLVARTESVLRQTAEFLNSAGPGTASWYACDIAQEPASAEHIIAYANQVMGVPTLLLNGAGGASIASAMDASWELWHKDFNTKFWAYLALMRAVLPGMMAARSGVIINILGVAGKDPNSNLAIASAVNGALRAVSKVLSNDVKSHQVRIVNVNPGATETGLLSEMASGLAIRNGQSQEAVLAEMRASAPFGALPGAQDIAGLIVFLMSDQARFITGTSIDVDGGAHHGLA